MYPAPEPETHPEPTPTPEPETETKEPTTRDYVVSLIEKAKQTLDDADIAAAKKAAAEFSVQERTDEAMELRMQANELDTEKEKVKPQPQPQQVDDVDGMTWAELKDEAKALGIKNPGQIKKDALKERIRKARQEMADKEARAAEQAKAKALTPEEAAELRAHLDPIREKMKATDDINELNRLVSEARAHPLRMKKTGAYNEIERVAGDIRAKIKKINEAAEPIKTTSSKGMKVDVIQIDQRDPKESGVIPTERVGKNETVVKANQSIPITYALVPISDLITSHNEMSFEKTKGYPQELQNRSREETRDTVSETARDLDPKLLAGAAVASDGRPIVVMDENGNMFVMSGNRRTMALKLRQAGEFGNLDEYSAYIRKELHNFGIKDQDTEGMALVGIYHGDGNLLELSRLLNESEAQAKSKTDIATSDAVLIADAKNDGKDVIALLDSKAKGLMTEGNEKFIEEFLNEFIQDRTEYVSSSGEYTTALRDRIENALFMYIFNGDKKARGLLSALKEVGDSPVKSIAKAIIENVKQIALLRNLIEQHNLEDYDITQDILDAMTEIARLRNEGIPVEDHIDQTDIFSEGESVIPEHLRNFYIALGGIRSFKAADEFIGGYYASAQAALDPHQTDVFAADYVKTKEEFIDNYAKEWNKARPADKAKGKKQPDTKPTVPQGVGADTKQTSGETPKDSGKPGQGRKIKPAKMSQAEYARQMHEALSGKLDAAQIDGIIAVMDAMMQTYADEMGITIDQAYVENVHSVDNAPIPEEKPSKPLKQESSKEILEAKRQEAEVRKQYEGTDKWLKAPNGKPTKLTERQWLQVRTPNFKAWFGDWENDPKNASKVVDENGEPRVVWHGTENGGFTEFSKDKLGSNTGAPSARRGFFFAGKESTSTSVSYRGDGITETSSTLSSVIESVENLAFYATRMLSDIGATGYSDDYSEDLSFDIRHAAYKYSGDHKGYERAIISLLRNIEGDVGNNAKTIIEYGYSQTDIDDAIESLRHADDAIEGIRTDFSFGEPDETMYSVFLNVRNPIEHDYYGRERGISFDKMLSTAQEQGDDGAVFKNIRDGGMFDDIFVAFEPEQIKSATGNMGTYSQETANIFKQPGAISLDGIVQGYIEKRKDGTHHIGFLDPDVSTGLHEQAHLGRELLAKLAEKSPEWRRLYDAAEEWCGVENGVWTTEAEEKFARGFEKYVYEGHAPNAKLKTLYSRLKEWMRAIIDKLKELADIKLDKNILDVYDALFGGGIKKGVENKKLHVKNAFTVEQMKSTDPHKLTAALDKVGDNFGCIVDTKGLGSRASILMTDLETGKVIVSISRVADGYEVNGYHAANNGEAISRANDILGNVLRQEKQQTSPDIAEARRQMEEVRKQYEKPIAIDTVLKMAEEEFKTNPPEGFKYVRDLGESIARVETDNTIVLTEAFFGHSQKDRKEILYHEMAHRDTRELIKDHKKFWELVESGWFGHFDKEAMKWKGKFGGRNADEDITEAVAQYRMNPSAFESKHGKEMTDAVKELSGDFKTGYMKAPNGKPTKLTERQWLQVRTPNFKAWFGDWENDPKNASKVVDENGEPLVVYHGTPGQMHNEFHGGSRHYFSDNALVSEQYAGYNEDQIYDVYLNMKNPVIVDAEGKRYSSSKEFARAERNADNAGHDGAIIKNVDDSRWLLKGSTVFNGTTFIAISNTQIKSATDNVGTFDSTQPNILYQTKNKEMLTIHNISEDNLQQVIKQGGLPMPSLAVINTKETKHDEFGEISLIADPSIMDVSRKNPVYSQDAWTPTYPTVYSRVDESSRADAQWIADRINKRYNAKIKVYEIMNDAQRQNSTGTIEEIVARKVSEAAAKNYNAKHEVLTPAQEYYDDALKYVRHLLRIRPLKIREEIRGLNDRYGNARYRPNTAEEAIKVMRHERNRADNQIWESRELIGKIAPMFSSMAAVDKNRWRLMSKAARESAVESIDVDLQKIVKYSKEKRVEYRGYAATTDVVNDIYDIAKGDMKYVRQRYAPDTDFSAFHEIIKKIKKIPTDMFESKPDRVVKLSEFAAAIVPYGTDYKTLKALKDAGLNIAFYERGDMDDRHDKVVHEAEKSAILFQAQKSAPEGTVSVKTAAQRRAEAQETVIRSAAMLKSKLNKTNNVHEMTELMQKAVGTWIRLMYPGAAPLDGLEEYTMVADLSELDPDTKEYKALARKLARKRAADRKFRDAMLDNTGFSDTGDIPFENLYASLSAINPAAFDRVVKDESMDMLIDLIPGIKEAFGLKEGESIDLKLLQKIYDATFTSSPEVGDSKAVRPFRLPHRRLISAFGKAGQKLIDLGYKGTLKMAEYELLYTPKLRELHELIRSNQNNRGKKYEGDALKAISETMMVINSKQDIADDQKLDAIKKSMKEWSERNNEVINEKDIEGIYNVTRDILDMFRDFIVKFNQDPNHKKIGIREDYGDPRRYDWLRAAQTSIEGGVLLHAPGHVKQRTKDELSANYDSFSRDIYGNYLGYVQLMSKYMAFYDFAEYLKDRKMRYIKGGKAQEIDLGSPMARDMTKAQIAAFEDSSMRKYIQDYAQGVIGIQRSGKKWDKRMSAWVNNVYSSALVFNVGLTLKNFNQRMLILSVVDPHVAGQVMKDYSFWKGLFKRDHEKYPTLSQIMQTYRDVNDSLIADLVSESKRMSDGETNPISKLYYDWTALNGNLLRLSPFSVAELGNRAYGHAAGVYQIIMNSPDYRDARKTMGVHEAMEYAISNNNALREAAITYGGIINAEINADANPAFAPMFFNGASGINKIATFVRYGITLANLELRTFGSSSSMKSMLSPDMFKLWTSGEIKAASLSTKLQSAQIFYRALTDSNIAKLVEKSRMSSKDESDMLTTKQVKMVRELIGEQIEIVEKAIKGDYRHIVRGSKGKLIAELGLIGFAVAEAIIGFLHNIIVAMLPWWQKDSPLDDGIQIGLNDVLELSQTTSMFTDFRLGAGITPNLNAYYGSDKTTIKDAARWINRGTPFMGHVNQAIREATGKYGTDYIVDEIFDIME